ncbi:uncharacterized membrane protein YhaH (DUF805 family) [Mucilaginibacter sp. UYNi724]
MFNDSFSFDGRISRTEYGLSILVFIGGIFFISSQLRHHNSSNSYLLMFIPLIWFRWAQGAKRCHDLDNSGWWQLVPFYTFWLLLEEGKPWPNEYGKNPKYAHLPDEAFHPKNPYDQNDQRPQ